MMWRPGMRIGAPLILPRLEHSRGCRRSTSPIVPQRIFLVESASAPHLRAHSFATPSSYSSTSRLLHSIYLRRPLWLGSNDYARPSFGRRRGSSEPALTPIRIGMPASPAALATSFTLSSNCLMLPGFTRTAAQPASIAANIYFG